MKAWLVFRLLPRALQNSDAHDFAERESSPFFSRSFGCLAVSATHQHTPTPPIKPKLCSSKNFERSSMRPRNQFRSSCKENAPLRPACVSKEMMFHSDHSKTTLLLSQITTTMFFLGFFFFFGQKRRTLSLFRGALFVPEGVTRRPKGHSHNPHTFSIS